jgi:hypothetical protein
MRERSSCVDPSSHNPLPRERNWRAELSSGSGGGGRVWRPESAAPLRAGVQISPADCVVVVRCLNHGGAPLGRDLGSHKTAERPRGDIPLSLSFLRGVFDGEWRRGLMEEDVHCDESRPR